MRKGKTLCEATQSVHRGPCEAYFWKLLFGQNYYGRMGDSQVFVGFHSGPSKWSSETPPGKAKADSAFSQSPKLHCDYRPK